MKVRTQTSQRTTPVSKIHFCGSKRLTALLALLAIGVCSVVTAGQVTLTWNANIESDLSGYNVHYGLSGGSYDTVLDVGNQTSVLISNLADGSTYEFAVTAYNTSGTESDYSSPVAYTATPTTTTPGLNEIIIDNSTANTSYTGTWNASGASGSYGSNSLYSRNGDTYSWHFTPEESGYYECSMWWTEWSSRTDAADVSVAHATGNTSITINQQANCGQWNALGTFYYEAGTSYPVTLTSAPEPASTSADAVKFRRITPTLTGIQLEGALNIDENSSEQYTCRASYDNGTSKVISGATFSTDNSLATIDSTGLLSVGELESDASCRISVSYTEGDVVCIDVLDITLKNIIVEVPSEYIIDNSTAATSYTGTWKTSGASAYYGSDSLYSRDGDTYSWHFTPMASGHYECSMWWTEWKSRTTAATVTIQHDSGNTPVSINQQNNGGQWNPLGTFFYEAGTTYLVTITTSPSPASTCADAVKFTLVTQQTNTEPVAQEDVAETVAGSAINIAVLTNDSDADGDALTVTAVTQAANGSVTFTAQNITYTPSAGFSGSDSFTYTVSDGNGATASATVTVEVMQLPAITSTPGTEALVGETYVYDVVTTGYPQPALTLISAPTDMTLDPQSGHIQWSPQAGGDYTVVVEAVNEAGSVRQEFAISVIDPAAIPELPTTSEPTTSETTWTLALDIENTSAAGQLIISQATTAGDNIDTGLDEAMTTNLPAYLEGPETTPKLVTDVRSSYANRIKWILTVDQANAIMRWNAAGESTQTSLTIAELDANGALIPNTEIDMTLDSELILGDAGTRYCISRVDLAATYEVIDITAGWNLISFSLQGDDDSVDNVFTGLNDGPVWSFNASTGTYEAASTVQPKVGYWFYSNEDTVLVHLGTPATDGLLSLNKGWNLVGSLDTCPVPDNSALVTQAIWELDPTTKQYQNATSFSAGAGYWIYATEATDIILK